jgi:hypothetical protein
MNRIRLAAITALSLVALGGCISTSMEVDLNSDGSGDIVLSYEFDEALYDMGVFDGSDVARPIPVTREEFEQAALVTGMQLRSYRFRNNEGAITVRARLSFSDIEELASLLGPEQLQVELDANGGSLRYLLASSSDPELVSPSIAEDLDPFTIRLVVDTPGSVRETNGTILEDGSVEFSTTLGALASSSEEISWEIAW